ncbi:MAG: ATP-binding protein [Lachnospiraceae bacterium]|nr:ATP-binding protein [Lachnospiraceae bacterium]
MIKTGKKKLPIGIEDFAKLRTNDFYYVDKTSMIKELLDDWGEVNLFTRPRRFGKSLNMSMLRRFFEIGTDRSLFDGLAISKETALCEKYMGKFPVISITLKNVEADRFETARNLLVRVINEEARRLRFLLDSDKFSQWDRMDFESLFDREMNDDTLFDSLKRMSEFLQKYYDHKVIVLIDEYDVPLAKASQYKYYGEMVGVIRSLFDAALKSNPYLEFAVMTGCLRVAKESIFTGLNNPKMYTMLDARCDEQFGFTDEEVVQMLGYYGVSDYYGLTKEWYDGYRIGSAGVYNPWDVVNWCDQLLTNPNKVPKSYWANSSGNEEVRKFIQKLDNGLTKAEVERLISGETVQKKIEEQLTYDTMYNSIDNMWSLLYATGYLTQSETPMGNLVRLTIPNSEVRNIFSDSILGLFKERISGDGEAVNVFCEALKDGDAEGVESRFTEFLKNTISIRDTAVKKEFKESFYHGILLGILGFKGSWGVTSNRESGDGYYDIAIEIEDEEIGIIIEVKYAENGKFEAECGKALKQINDRNYVAELRLDGMSTILKYGIACCRKECRAVLEREE